jgi:hypothetical protein
MNALNMFSNQYARYLNWLKTKKGNPAKQVSGLTLPAWLMAKKTSLTNRHHAELFLFCIIPNNNFISDYFVFCGGGPMTILGLIQSLYIKVVY